LDKYKEDMDAISLEAGDYANGINENRSCTDFFCLVVFLVFLGAMCGVTFYGISQGQVEKMIAPIDMNLNFCGIEGPRADFHKLYFTNLRVSSATDILNSGICMKTCPVQGQQIDILNVHPDDVTAIQTYNEQYNDVGTPPNAYGSKSVIDFCIPSPSAFKTQRPDEVANWDAALKAMTAGGAGAKLNDLYLSSRAIYWSMGLAFVFCILYIYTMSIFAEYLAWGLIILTQIALFAVAAGAFIQRSQEDNAEVQKSLLFTGIGASIFAVLFLVMICCGYSQLKTAIDVIDAAADFLAKTKRIILVPICYFFVTMIVLSIWLGAVMCVMSMGTVSAEDNQQKSISYGDDKKLEKKVFYMLCFMFFGLLWILNFLKAQSSFITMVSASTYYFDSNSEKDGSADVGLGIKFAFMFHAGSLAMGSFIIALIQFIRITFAVLAEQAKNASGDNAAVKIIIKIAECCLKCIERITDYITTMAYGYIAVSGDSFCTGAWNGFLLNMKFGLEFAWANFIASTFILLGKVGITVLNCFSCYLIMKHITHDLDEITSTAAPLAIVALVTFAAANIFLGLFDEAVLAMLVCLCVDKQINDGVAVKGPPTFHNSVEKG
jgi:hypothetical protein